MISVSRKKKKKNTMLSFLKIQIYVLKWTVILLAPLFVRCAFKLVEVLMKVPFPKQLM